MVGKFWWIWYIMVGKEIGIDIIYCGGKIIFVYKLLNISNWIKIMDCKWKYVYLGYKLYNM